MIVAAAMHGILTPPGGEVRTPWPDDFATYCAEYAPGRLTILTDSYYAFPFPRLNYFRNHRIAKRLAHRLRLYADRGAEVHLVGHSNGAVICNLAARHLWRTGHRVETLTLIAGAGTSDVRRAGIYQAVAANKLGHAEAWASIEDEVIGLPWWLTWPYGRLGVQGFRLQGRRFEAAPHILTRWFPAYLHNDYLHPADARDGAFEEILGIIDPAA